MHPEPDKDPRDVSLFRYTDVPVPWAYDEDPTEPMLMKFDSSPDYDWTDEAR